ncbi:MAG: hypothetical protein ACJ0IZ_00120 [Verrucomicrobiales bacterium]
MSEPKQTSSSNNDWLIATCPDCSKQIKAKREILQTASSITCPYCQSSFNIGNDSKGHSEEHQYAKAEKLTETPEKGIRKRKSSKKRKIIGWDLEEVDQGDDQNEVVIVQDSSGNEVRKIRRRSKKGTTHSKAYKTLTRSSLAILTGSGVILLGAIIYKGFKTIDRDLSVSNNSIEPIFEEVIKDISINLTNEERDTCMDIIKSFLDNSEDIKIEDLILHPEITMPRINEDIYGPGGESYEGILYSIKREINGKFIILLNLKISNEARSRTFAFEQTQESIKMNWEVSFGHQMMKVSDFITTKPKAAQTFRVSLRLGDYYAYLYNNDSIWQCLEVSYPNDELSKTFAYVKRDSSLGADIINQLKTTESILRSTEASTDPLRVIAKLQFNDDSDQINQVELKEILQYNWF